jgi:hypothetical protein
MVLGMLVFLGYTSGIGEGDSGDELGEVSVTTGESNIEIVVVGEESVDSDGIDEMLSRREGSDGCEVEVRNLEESSNVCDLDELSPSWFPDFTPEFIAPNTDIRDGNVAGIGEELIRTGILGYEIPNSLRLVETAHPRPLVSFSRPSSALTNADGCL